MDAKELTVLANKLAVQIKKAKKSKLDDITMDLRTAISMTKACTVLGRIMMLVEADAELITPAARLVGTEAGKAEVWGLIIQELDQLE